MSKPKLTKSKLPKDSVIVGDTVVPKFCECGGELEYAISFGRIWSVCKKCSPVVKIKMSDFGHAAKEEKASHE